MTMDGKKSKRKKTKVNNLQIEKIDIVISFTNMFQICCELLVLAGIFFPQLKILVFLYMLKTAWHVEDSGFHVYRLPKTLQILSSSFSANYFFWHFGVTFGTSILSRKIELEWITFLSIAYNLVVYNFIMLSFWKIYPLRGIAFVSILQYLDGIPLLNAIIDTTASVYHSPIVFIPEKIAFWGLCTVFEYFRK